MCGICGKLIFDREARVSPAVLQAMTDSIVHRGPDDEGFYFGGQVGLGFRRLSIIDLGGGHQPLSNEDASVWIVFNGEIYNYQELRQFLLSKGHQFKTQSDTEVIVHLYEELGEACLERLRGMFGFAIWDSRRRSLFLARDRVGIKPLYFYSSKRSFVFASEIKAILADPEVRPEVVPGMIDRALTFYYMPGEDTLLKDIHKLPPGSCALIKDGEVKIRQYWDLQAPKSELSLSEAEEQLSAMLEESSRLHMISDVPVGFLLSGGVDSSAMLCMARGKTDRPLHSFTVGFSEPGVTDERPFARLAADAYGTEHHEMTISAKDFENFLPQYVWHMEEPVCEPPAVAMFYVSQLARQFVKVLISGEGGDEGFGGYQIYRSILWLERLKSVLKPFNGGISKALLLLNSRLKSDRIAKYAPLFGEPFASYYYGGTSNSFNYFNQHLDALYSRDFAPLVNRQRSVSVMNQYFKKSDDGDLVNQMLYVDTKSRLVDDLLLKADKMTMASSVELRVPLLDHKILEFAASLPGNYKVRGFTTKYLLKKILSRRVPQEILNRKKVGFPVPYNAWMRNELKDSIRDLLLDRESLQRGYFNRDCIERLLAENTARGGSYSKEIFSLAVLELWHRQFLGKQEAPAGHGAYDPAPGLLTRT
jgi:asparagine synthase (glutamine-hydrolysing)